jgi:hypothetical protein
MNKRFVVLIEDDFEIKGNGLGNVADLQYLPALALCNIAKKYEAKITFMVDVAHLLILKKHAEKNRNIRLQRTILEETLLIIKEKGFDVQLHLHPQWLGSRFINGRFQVDGSWNIGSYPERDQGLLLSQSINYLQGLLQPHFPDYRIIAFKAGAWGLQPSGFFLNECIRSGIRIILAVRDGMKDPGAGIDYTHLEEKYLPYHPQVNDITKVNDFPNQLVVLPLQPFAPDLLSLSILATDTVRRKICSVADGAYYEENLSSPGIGTFSPLSVKNRFKFSFRPYLTQLKIGNQPFAYLKRSFDHVISRLRGKDLERIPIVIESHTKQYHAYHKHIDKFFGYIKEKYHDEVEFSDLTSFLREIEADPKLLKCRQNSP